MPACSTISGSWLHGPLSFGLRVEGSRLRMWRDEMQIGFMLFLNQTCEDTYIIYTYIYIEKERERERECVGIQARVLRVKQVSF